MPWGVPVAAQRECGERCESELSERRVAHCDTVIRSAHESDDEGATRGLPNRP
jgi:hypothetical protein